MAKGTGECYCTMLAAVSSVEEQGFEEWGWLLLHAFPTLISHLWSPLAAAAVLAQLWRKQMRQVLVALGRMDLCSMSRLAVEGALPRAFTIVWNVIPINTFHHQKTFPSLHTTSISHPGTQNPSVGLYIQCYLLELEEHPEFTSKLKFCLNPTLEMRTNKTLISSMDIQGEFFFPSDSQVSPPFFLQKKEILSAKSFLLHFPLCFKHQLYSNLDIALLRQRYHFQTVFALNLRASNTLVLGEWTIFTLE